MINEQKWNNENYWVSNYNFIDAVRSQFQLPQEVKVHDATLRDGEQTPGIVLRKNEKVRIAEMLDEIGVNRIEAGMPVVSKEDAEAIEEIAKRVKRAEVFAFVRAMPDDVNIASECGAKGVVIEVPIGKPKLQYQFNWTWEKTLERSIDTILRAKELGMYVVYFPYDTTRSDEDDFDNLLKGIMASAVPDSVGVIDTTGCANQAAIKYLVKKVKDITSLPVEIHTHNDIGMAVANGMAAVEAGATVVHTCVNGLGERTGNAALEEVIVALRTMYGYDTDYKYEKLAELSAYVQEKTGFMLPPNKPIVGNGNFTRESGIGIDMLFKHPLAMFSINPPFVGQKPKIVLGKKSGVASIQYKFSELGISCDDENKIAEILLEVKKLGIDKKGLINDEEFMKITKRILG